MGVSARHTRRILAAYREEGAAALAHGHRGRRAPNKTPETLRSEVLRLARSRYSETNHTHLSELLREREGIEIGRTTLRHILTSAGLKSPRHRRPPRHRVRRQRMPRAGMLVQVDGSHHRWLGDHGPPFALLLAVDDATGIVVNAMFFEQKSEQDNVASCDRRRLLHCSRERRCIWHFRTHRNREVSNGSVACWGAYTRGLTASDFPR